MEEYSESDSGAVPSPLVKKVPLSYADQRGTIHNLMESPCGGVALIWSRAGTARSDHWHREDWHWIYVLSGIMEYYERPAGATDAPHKRVVLPGQMVYTAPGMEHATRFPVDTEIISMSKRSRTHEEHESDLVRLEVPLV